MIDAIKGIFSAITTLIDIIVYFVTGIFDFLGMILKCVVLIRDYILLMPLELQIFAFAFMYVFVIMAVMQIARSII